MAAADRGTIVEFAGSAASTITLPSAATVGAGWSMILKHFAYRSGDGQPWRGRAALAGPRTHGYRSGDGQPRRWRAVLAGPPADDQPVADRLPRVAYPGSAGPQPWGRARSPRP
jgi:hypothetical protein